VSESDAEISAAFIDAVEASLGDLVPKDLFALARRGAAMQWRPIETAPRDGTEFIAYRPDAGVFTAGYDDEQDAWFANHGYEDITDDLPTRWMPLPLPPSGEQSDDR